MVNYGRLVRTNGCEYDCLFIEVLWPNVKNKKIRLTNANRIFLVSSKFKLTVQLWACGAL